MKPDQTAWLTLLLAGMLAGSLDAAILAPSEQTAVLGVTPEIPIPVSLSLAPEDLASTLQFELHYDAGRLTLMRVDTGPAGLESGKVIGWYSPSAGVVRAVLFGSNLVNLRSGVVALPCFRPAADVQAGSTVIQISKVVVSSPHATAVASTGGSSLLTFSPPGNADSLELAKAYPNPFCPASGHTRIYFGPLPGSATIQIHMLSGALVREIRHEGGGLEIWDATNQAGLGLASGVYIYFMTAPRGQKKSGKLVIIR